MFLKVQFSVTENQHLRAFTCLCLLCFTDMLHGLVVFITLLIVITLTRTVLLQLSLTSLCQVSLGFLVISCFFENLLGKPFFENLICESSWKTLWKKPPWKTL